MASMDEKILEQLKRSDPIMTSLIENLGESAHDCTPNMSTDYFADLCEAIVNQQLSEKAGRTIYNRFLDLLPKRKPHAEFVLKIPDQKLRDVGMSWSKVKYIKSLAQSVLAKQIDFSSLNGLSDDEAISELTKLHGIGPWSAEMFLMFSLGRPDMFSYGDAGLRRAIKQFYGFKKNPTEKQLSVIIQKWSPYKTYACRILWKSLDLKNTV